jgi:hypothetical protein
LLVKILFELSVLYFFGDDLIIVGFVRLIFDGSGGGGGGGAIGMDAIDDADNSFFIV